MPSKIIENGRVEQDNLTPVQKFYSNTNVLITGSTGFLGTVLLEKLLRSFPTISTIYLLIRIKKGKSMEKRLDEMFDDIIFERMKRECPYFHKKIVGIVGDCALPDLGLSTQDKKLLTDEVNIIFHVAATVRFDENLKTAVNINIRAVRDLLKMAQQMPNLKSLVYVSTAYSNCLRGVIEEKIYPASIDYDDLILLTENLPEDVLDDITPILTRKYPNTYTFTKHIAENTVKEEGRGLPVGIARPSIVISTYREPIKGWINNMNGPAGITAGAAIGILKVLHSDSKNNAALVPVDMCVNSFIGMAWEIGTTFEKIKTMDIKYDIPVYHYEFSEDQPINWSQFFALSVKYGFPYMTSMTVWYCSVLFCKSRLVYRICDFLLHMVPAIIIDGILLGIGKPSWALKCYSKVYNYSTLFSAFVTKDWNFRSLNTRKLITKMSEKDREILFCDPKELVWDTFFRSYFLGIRLYLLKDPLETLPAALKRHRRLYWAHQATKIVFGLLGLWLLWSLLSFVCSLIV